MSVLTDRSSFTIPRSGVALPAVAAAAAVLSTGRLHPIAAVAFFLALRGARRWDARLQRLAVVVVALTALQPPLSVWLRAGLVAMSAVTLLGWAKTAVTRRRSRANLHPGERTLLVGDSAAVASAAHLFARYPEHQVRPVATATPDGCAPTVLPAARFGSLAEMVDAHRVSHVVVVSTVPADVESSLAAMRATGVRVSVRPPLADVLTPAVDIVDIRGIPFVSLAPRRAPHGPAWAAKRAFDFVAASVGILLVSPLLLLAAAAVKLDTPGPVFFRQRRVGRNGKLFGMWKFRSMVVDAEERLHELQHQNEASGPYFKIEDDPRVTRVGRWLRRLSIDELPQLFNVVRGEMSLVGPRPFLASELAADPEAFEWRIPYLPGITGLWQVAGRSWLPRLEGIRMDRSYIENWSFALDLRILLRTVRVAFEGDRRPPISRDDENGLDRIKYLGRVDGDDLQPSGEAPDLSVVIVSHESANDIRACLRSLTSVSDKVTREVVVVDNASSDGTADIVASEFPDVRLIRKRIRDGFSVNSNIGAVTSAGQHLLMLNPDTEVFDGALDALVDYLQAHPGAGAVGPRLVYPDGSPQASARRFPRPWATLVRRTPPLRRFLGSHPAVQRHLMGDTDSIPSDVDWLLGAAIAVRTDAFRQIGGFDDKFRLYCEDIDLCWRLQDAGWRVNYLPTVTVQHALGEHTSKRFFTRRTIWHFRSMVRFLRLHGFRRPGYEPRPVPVFGDLPAYEIAG